MTITIKQPESPEEFSQYYELRWRILRAPIVGADAPARATTARWLVPVLSIVCALTVAVSHRANEDDAFYLNMAVAAADAPAAPLLAGDTLHGYDDVPMDLPVFRINGPAPVPSETTDWGSVKSLYR